MNLINNDLIRVGLIGLDRCGRDIYIRILREMKDMYKIIAVA